MNAVGSVVCDPLPTLLVEVNHAVDYEVIALTRFIGIVTIEMQDEVLAKSYAMSFEIGQRSCRVEHNLVCPPSGVQKIDVDSRRSAHRGISLRPSQLEVWGGRCYPGLGCSPFSRKTLSASNGVRPNISA